MKENNAERKGSIADRVAALVSPVAEELGLYIWDVEFAKRGPDYYLTVTIDSDEGIDIEDCEKMHRAIDPVLDEADPIEKAYMLEVSSPGIERDLKKDEHFEWALEETVELKLFAAVNGTKTVKGRLAAFDSASVTVAQASGDTVIERKNISKAKTVFDFGK
ncbi:MAG: ribosome maturation factor RimP [Ruminococcaceae bacterium]|nr:ribosome maturation factor RimP [Oscillospiraceae bacterium]